MKTPLLFVSLLLSLTALPAHAADCLHTSAGQPVRTGDALGRLLEVAPECPKDVLELRALLLQHGASFRTAFVSNRGFHNPGQGSFSLFEMVQAPGVAEGDFFFGHFTAPSPDGNALSLDQTPRPRALMIELIVWDPGKGYYNFYELIGDGAQGRWIYRGDSRDILADAGWLWLQPDPAHPRFGNTLRCAGCHTGGGPIMKELASPHNDWWTPERPLPLGPRQPDAHLAQALKTIVPSDVLAHAVVTGARKLEASPGFLAVKAAQTLPQRLRPLFCTTEINLASDRAPLDAPGTTIEVPSPFFVDPRLAGGSLTAPKALYASALQAAGSRFPEIQRYDADHAWLAPVRSLSDQLSVEGLVASGLIDRSFVTAVLAVDFTTPVLSPVRCALLRAVPELPSADWKARLRDRLAQFARGADPVAAGARELLANLSDPARGQAFHQTRVRAFLAACAARLSTPAGMSSLVQLLNSRRRAVFAAELSRNPLGQILEPGFRVIFPVPAAMPRPDLGLSESCEVLPR